MVILPEHNGLHAKQPHIIIPFCTLCNLVGWQGLQITEHACVLAQSVSTVHFTRKVAQVGHMFCLKKNPMVC